MTPIDDTPALQQKRAAGEGYIYNVLHMATCRQLEKGTVPPRKFFSLDLASAVDWLTTNRGVEGQNWKRCDAHNSHCFG